MKRIYSLATSAVVLVCLAGCGGGGGSSSEDCILGSSEIGKCEI